MIHVALAIAVLCGAGTSHAIPSRPEATPSRLAGLSILDGLRGEWNNASVPQLKLTFEPSAGGSEQEPEIMVERGDEHRAIYQLGKSDDLRMTVHSDAFGDVVLKAEPTSDPMVLRFRAIPGQSAPRGGEERLESMELRRTASGDLMQTWISRRGDVPRELKVSWLRAR